MATAGRKRIRLQAVAVVLSASFGLASFVVGTTANAATYSETTGGAANTWTNYTNAGGTQGPTIPAFTTVQITCALTGFRVADGNTWWYQIASAPWNNQYYVSADAFYNNGATSGSLAGTPFVDPAVPVCGTTPPTTQAPARVVTLAQGPAAPAGYRYAITLDHFAANTTIAVNCYDTVSPGGFYPFTMTTDGAGHAFTQSQCYSGDGPDHWVIAGGVTSNHVTWGAGGGGGGATTTTTTVPGGGGTVSSDPRPTAALVTPTPARPNYPAPRPKAMKSRIPPVGAAVLRASCNAQFFAGWLNAARLCKHYERASGTEYVIAMGDLIWSERPLWASLEKYLRDGVANAYGQASNGPPSGAVTRSFNSGWVNYEATQGDWAQALHGFSFRVYGDVWVGPANAAGVRPVQIRYRSQMADVYNFNPNNTLQQPLYDAATKGWAAEYWVSGNTVARTVTTNSTLNISGLPFEW